MLVVKRGRVFVFRSGCAMDLALQQGCDKHADQHESKHGVCFTMRNGQHGQPHGERYVAQSRNVRTVQVDSSCGHCMPERWIIA